MDILIIDDDSASVFLAKLLLSRAGLFKTITSFQNPVDALSFIQVQILEPDLPQIVLLDINMPFMDGWELLEELKPYQTQLLKKCSIFMLTSSIDNLDVIRAKEHPLVTDLISKPLDLTKIHEFYQRVI